MVARMKNVENYRYKLNCILSEVIRQLLLVTSAPEEKRYNICKVGKKENEIQVDTTNHLHYEKSLLVTEKSFIGKIQFLATVLMLKCLAQISTAQCIHPPDAEKQKLQLRKKVFRDYLLGHWTYNVIDEYRKNTRPPRERNLIDLQTRQRKIYGEKSCRKNGNISHESDISSKSTCPWYIVLDVDMQREPQSIAKAKCSCKRCFTVDRSGKSRDRCKEVNSYIPVIKWRCSNNYSGSRKNYFKYFVDFETVPVGCTCKRPIEVANKS
ncbi:uncharacterized protein LOC123533180 [Mercenaria mercenaria]|uniref:uncharacterized protein LOC123533180 n=1 Tax=Mercenaria mercenaria TaxID=6596 RepID=UPI00234F9DFB|nr:uncharacterized protein LOC123533180 [Mercenaria mercenaria]